MNFKLKIVVRKLFTLFDLVARIGGLDRKVDHSATDLNGFVVTGKEWSPLLDQNESSKLTLVVLEHELAVFEFDLRVASTNRNVVDAEVALVAAAQLEHFFLWSGSDNMNNATCVFLLV